MLDSNCLSPLTSGQRCFTDIRESRVYFAKLLKSFGAFSLPRTSSITKLNKPESLTRVVGQSLTAAEKQLSSIRESESAQMPFILVSILHLAMTKPHS